MTTVMVYGADEFIGALVADQARLQWTSPGAPELVVAGRRKSKLATLAAQLGVSYQVFDWRDASAVPAALSVVDVLVNAATPFEKTVEALAKPALEAGCSYLDLNSEMDVERHRGTWDATATTQLRSLVSGAGPSAALSSVLVGAAIDALVGNGKLAAGERIGAIRLAASCVVGFSRSSAASVWRALDRDVFVGTVGHAMPPAPPVLVLKPGSKRIGELERTFDFAVGAAKPPDLRIASAATLVDGHAAALAAIARGHEVGAIETYVQMSTPARLAYAGGAGLRALLTPAFTFDTVGAISEAAFGVWPDGPPAVERDLERYTLLLQVEDALGTPLVDWRLEVPNLYETTARLAASMAARLPNGPPWSVRPETLLAATLQQPTPIEALPGAMIDRRTLP